MATIILSSTLTQYTKDHSKVEVSGKTLFTVMLNLIQKFPHLRQHLFDINGDLTRNMNFFVNDKGIAPKKWQSIPVNSKDVVSILLAGKGKMQQLKIKGLFDLIRPGINDKHDRLSSSKLN